MWDLDHKEGWALKKWCFQVVVLEKNLESPLDFKQVKAVHPLTLNIDWKDWCWSLSADTLATWCEELIHLKRPWWWERLRAGGEGGGQRMRWLDGITDSKDMSMSKSGRWWKTGKPGVLPSMGFQRVRHDWASEQIYYDVHRALTFQEISPQIKLILVFTFSENKYPSFSCI